jgi:hypothetical protein
LQYYLDFQSLIPKRCINPGLKRDIPFPLKEHRSQCISAPPTSSPNSFSQFWEKGSRSEKLSFLLRLLNLAEGWGEGEPPMPHSLSISEFGMLEIPQQKALEICTQELLLLLYSRKKLYMLPRSAARTKITTGPATIIKPTIDNWATTSQLIAPILSNAPLIKSIISPEY